MRGLQLAYVKPHGALYNDMMANPMCARPSCRPWPVIIGRCRCCCRRHPRPPGTGRKRPLGVAVQFEAFADRCYDDDGSLLSRRASPVPCTTPSACWRR